MVAVGIAAGAFGTHALRAVVSSDSLHTWSTAAYYLMINGVGLAAVPFRGRGRLGVICICIGSTLFSGSLFALVSTGATVLGAITPVGGVLMIVGWLLAAVSFMRGTMDE
jgi:uncharacterized membrane protein YgdD (TMEM256/DUF423 family)